MRTPIRAVPLIGALTLIAGYAVAAGTGLRWLGGIVLVLGAAWCAGVWWKPVGPPRTVATLAIFALGFAVSHPLGHLVSAWPSVLLVAAVCWVASWLLGRSRTR